MSSTVPSTSGGAIPRLPPTWPPRAPRAAWPAVQSRPGATPPSLASGSVSPFARRGWIRPPGPSRWPAAEAAGQAQRTFDIEPGSLVLACQPGQRLLVTAGSPSLAVQRADDRFMVGLLGGALAIASALALAWLASGGLG